MEEAVAMTAVVHLVNSLFKVLLVGRLPIGRRSCLLGCPRSPWPSWPQGSSAVLSEVVSEALPERRRDP